MLSNYEIRQSARKMLTGNWGDVVIAMLIFNGITIALESFQNFGKIVLLAIIGPLTFGISTYILHFIRKNKSDFNFIFRGFSFQGNNLGIYGRTLAVSLLSTLYIFLWTLLFIIPGIIASIKYSMIYFIYSDDHNLGISETLRKSEKMMYGYKNQYFMLCLSFLGWFILCLFTFGIGFLWLSPYMQTSFALFYENLKKENSLDDDKTNEEIIISEEPIKIGGISK